MLALLKVLNLNPTPEQAVELLKQAAYGANSTLFRSLFSKANPAAINDTPLGGSSALDGLLRRAQDRSPWSNDTETNEETETLQCIEMLLDAGAKWRQPAEELRHVRRALLKHSPRYIVQVVRLLLYTPGAVDTPQFLEFCRSQSLASQIGVADAHLHEELKELRKSTRNVSASDVEAKTEIAPAVVEPPHTSPPALTPAAQVQPHPIPPAP